MNLADLEYDLPRERIAQRPAPARDAARLLHLDRGTGRIGHHAFRDLPGLLARAGEVPLPPYIRRDGDERAARADRERYQTVYADRPGSVAAPTAGLHFTPGVLAAAAAAGIGLARITLHVGPGTFRP